MKSVYYDIIAFIIVIGAFIYGFLRLMKRHAPFYFQQMLFAVGCYVLEELWSIVNILCHGVNTLISVRLFGVFGCFCFMYVANTGTFDHIIDERPAKSKKIRMISLFGPIALIAMLIIAFPIISPYLTVIQLIAVYAVLLPAIPASYYNVKHLMLPMDETGLLKAIRPLDALSLVVYFANFMYLYPVIRSAHLASGLYTLVMAVLMAVIVICCERGAKEWTTLI